MFTIRRHKLVSQQRSIDNVPSTFTSGTFAKTPKILVMHFTYGASAKSSAEWFRNPKNKGSSAHVVVERDGGVIQCVPFDTVAWHAGASRLRNLVGLNSYSLGIELANWGYLKRTPSGWRSHTGVPIGEPILAAHPNGNPERMMGDVGWEPYPEVQFQAAIAIASALVETYGINEIVGHQDISRGRKWDPGPAFSMDRFRSAVFGDRGLDRDTRLTVTSKEGLNLRRGPGTEYEVIQLLPFQSHIEVLEQRGSWLAASAIGKSGTPTVTGWVHSAFVGEI
jgi:N-acetylmuramoyl-L-alanine amidase